MSQDTEKYYLIFKEWSMDPNQWSILIDAVAVLLAIFGVLIAFFLYKKQRRDNAKDAFEFFQSSLPELKESIEKAVLDIKEFNQSLDLDNFVNPILSAALNDKFLSKISLVHLNRFYTNNRKNKLSNFKQLLIDSNFFGNYHSYVTKEINYFRNNYLEKKSSYSKWQLLRSNQFFSSIEEESENREYKEFYTNWVSNFNLKNYLTLSLLTKQSLQRLKAGKFLCTTRSISWLKTFCLLFSSAKVQMKRISLLMK